MVGFRVWGLGVKGLPGPTPPQGPVNRALMVLNSGHLGYIIEGSWGLSRA